MEHEIPHPHDKNWYEAQLKRLPPALRSKAQQGYQQVWKAAYSAEPVAHKRSNAARRAANIRLREFIEKIFA